MGLKGIPSVHELIRLLEADIYKMKILCLEGLSSDSVFSRFKRELGGGMDRLVSIFTGKFCELDSDMFVKLGADSTKLEA